MCVKFSNPIEYITHELEKCGGNLKNILLKNGVHTNNAHLKSTFLKSFTS